MWKLLPSICVLKIVRLIAIRDESKQTISACSGFGLLQMVSKSNIMWWDSEDAGSVNRVDCEILYRLERGTKHSL